MATVNKDRDVLGYRSVTWIAGLIGLLGGFLFGVWDSVTVIIDRGLSYNALSEMLSLSLYSVAIYSVLGCLGMVVIGVFSGFVVNVGRYQVSKSQLARIFIIIFVLLVVSVLLSGSFMFGNIVDIIESTVIGIVSGVGLAALSIYALLYVRDKGIRKEKLIALCISLFVSLLVLLYSGLLVNISLLSEEAFYRPTSLLTNFGLLILVGFMAVGLYVLSLFILQRYNPRVFRRAGYILLTIILCAFIVISFIGPFGDGKASIAGSGAAKGKPNILWIVMDTVRDDHLSCYGYYRDTTPNIDEIASEGILFENAISAASWTLPSHASMFTGMFSSKHGTNAEHQWLDDDFQTIAEVLHSHGYVTFGRSNNNYVSSETNLNQGFDTFESSWFGRFEAGSELADFLKVSGFKRTIQNCLLMDDGAHRTNGVVEKWIADANNAGTPFFIFINYMEAHAPYHPPKNYLMPYLNEEGDLEKVESVNRDRVAYITGKVQMGDEDFRILRALYDGEISYLDYRMGQLFDYLRELNILDNTVLIITSDHGQNWGDHHLMGHYLCVYDTLVRVPLIIRYPEVFEAGLRVDSQVQLTDIFPTILDIAGIDWEGEEQIQGYSLLGDVEQTGRSFAIAEHSIWHEVLEQLRTANRDFDFTVFARQLKTIRTEEYKYIWASDGRDELYNIRLDPEELNNLIDTEPEIASEMKAQLINWLNSFEPYRLGAAEQVK